MTGGARIQGQKRVPRRTCVICRELYPKRELVRIVHKQGEGIAFDLSGKAEGRGAYLCSKRSCWDKAALTDALGRALNVSLSEDDRRIIRTYGQKTHDVQLVDT